MKLGIRSRVMIIGTVPLVLLGLALGSYFTWDRLHDIDSTVNDSGNAIVRHLAPVFEYALVSGNTNYLKEIGEQTLTESGVLALRVIGQDGEEFWSGLSKAAQKRPISEFKTVKFSQPIIGLAVEFDDFPDNSGSDLDAQHEHGRVEVVLNKDMHRDQRLQALAGGSALTLISILAAFALGRRLSHQVTEPVLNLRDAVEWIRHGDLTTRIPVRSWGELAQLEAGFNDMADSLESSQMNLETKVQSATQALSDTVVELEASEYRYRDLFENSTDIVFTTDKVGHITSSNKAFNKQFSLQRSPTTHRSLFDLVPVDKRHTLKNLWENLQPGERQFLEIELITTDHGVRHYEIGLRAAFIDQVDWQVHVSAHDTTQRLQTITALAQAREAADDANQAKTAFLAMISHEIRTPLTGIVGYLQLLDETELTAEQQHYLKPVHQSARNFSRLVNDLLDLTRIEAGEFSLDVKVDSLFETVSAPLRLLQPKLDRCQIKLRTEKSPSLIEYAYIDAQRMGQIITNLVDNAINHSQPGDTVTLNLDVEDTRQPAMLIVQVTDEGHGIQDDDLNRIFEPFHTNRAMERDPEIDSTPINTSGIGLGLTITQGLVQLMKGSIDVESIPGLGTTFTAQIPLTPATTADVERARKAAQSDDSQRLATNITPATNENLDLTTLVVDDNEITRSYLCDALATLSIPAHEASTSTGALNLFQDLKPDLVLMDLHMPDSDGLTLIEQMRQLDTENPTATTRQTLFVVVTADIQAETRQRCLNQGVDGFLSKPLSSTELKHCISTLLLATHTQSACPIQYTSPSTDTIAPLERSPNAARPITTSSPMIINESAALALADGDRDLWLSNLTFFQQALNEFNQQIVALHSDFTGVHNQPDSDLSLTQLAHKYAGSAAYVGAQPLENSLRAIANSKHPVSRAELDRLYADWDSEWLRFQSEWREIQGRILQPST